MTQYIFETVYVYVYEPVAHGVVWSSARSIQSDTGRQIPGRQNEGYYLDFTGFWCSASAGAGNRAVVHFLPGTHFWSSWAPFSSRQGYPRPSFIPHRRFLSNRNLLAACMANIARAPRNSQSVSGLSHSFGGAEAQIHIQPLAVVVPAHRLTVGYTTTERGAACLWERGVQASKGTHH